MCITSGNIGECFKRRERGGERERREGGREGERGGRRERGGREEKEERGREKKERELLTVVVHIRSSLVCSWEYLVIRRHHTLQTTNQQYTTSYSHDKFFN